MLYLTEESSCVVITVSKIIYKTTYINQVMLKYLSMKEFLCKNKKKIINFSVGLLLLLTSPIFAQNDSLSMPANIIARDPPQPKITFKGLFQARYLEGFKKNVDVEGLHHSDPENAVNNSFDVKRARIQVKATISNRTEAVILMNLADFKSDPKNKVLENAYIGYTFNKYMKITVGQFRPFFGLENTYPVDIIKSMDFSNQYYEFGNNGWESFQTGIGISGNAKINNMPISYGLSVFNGNGRNQKSDKDNGKQYAGRFVMELSKANSIRLGLNGGIGRVFNKDVYATGLDITSNFRIKENLFFELQLEAKQGTNHNLYFKTLPEDRLTEINQYLMRGIYILPNIRYEVNSNRINSIEFSCRYEIFDSSFRQNSNERQTWLPMLSLEFLKDYNARIQVGVQIDKYKRNIADSSTYNNQLFIIQLQSRL